MVCMTSGGVGGPHRFTLWVDGFQARSDVEIWYTTAKIDRIDGAGSVMGSTAGDELVVLHGEAFGPVGVERRVRYGPGRIADHRWRNASNCIVVGPLGRARDGA